MKKIVFAFMGILFIVIAHSQANTFPTSGNVGIGTVSPGVKLHVVSGEPENWAAAFINSNGAGSYFGYGSSSGAFINAGPNASSSSYALNVNKVGNPLFYVRGDGNVGIGTSIPGVKLEVKGLGSGSNLLANAASNISVVDENNYASNVGGGLLFGGGFTSAGAVTTFGGIRGVKSNNTSGNYDGQLEFFTRSTGVDNWTNAQRMVITSNGNVGIGTTGSFSEKLSVNGSIRAKKIIVSQSGWSDYVFYDNYPLRSLQDLEKFINKNKHLPDVPSAKDVEEKGINVGDNQVVLLKKIEELTLYIIRMGKEKQALEQRLWDVEKKVKRK